MESSLNRAIRKIKADKIKKDNTKTKAKILKENLSEIALKKGVELVKKKK